MECCTSVLVAVEMKQSQSGQTIMLGSPIFICDIFQLSGTKVMNKWVPTCKTYCINDFYWSRFFWSLLAIMQLRV